MSAEQQLTEPRLRAMTHAQLVAAYLALDAKLRRREQAFRLVVDERNALRNELAQVVQAVAQRQEGQG
jgi:hypothetical protein